MLTTREWRQGEELSTAWFASHRGMTLLHLAASLGYSRLVCTMLHWRAENSSLLLETEVDALSQDDEGYTPLVCIRHYYHQYFITVILRFEKLVYFFSFNIKSCTHLNKFELFFCYNF